MKLLARTAQAKGQPKVGSNHWKTYEVSRLEIRPGSAKGKFEARVYLADGRVKKIVISASPKYFNDLEGEERRRETKYPLD